MADLPNETEQKMVSIYLKELENPAIEPNTRRLIIEALTRIGQTVPEPNGHAKDWDYIVVDKFCVFPTDPPFYQIVIDGRTIELQAADLLNAQMFRQKYFDAFGIMLQPLSPGKWATWLTQSRIDGIIMHPPDVAGSEHNDIVEVVLDYVRGCRPVKDQKDANRAGVYLQLEGEQTILIPGFYLKEVLLTAGYNKTSSSRLHYLLTDYLADVSRVVRIGDKVARFWVFKRNIVDEHQALMVADDKDD